MDRYSHWVAKWRRCCLRGGVPARPQRKAGCDPSGALAQNRRSVGSRLLSSVKVQRLIATRMANAPSARRSQPTGRCLRSLDLLSLICAGSYTRTAPKASNEWNDDTQHRSPRSRSRPGTEPMARWGVSIGSSSGRKARRSNNSAGTQVSIRARSCRSSPTPSCFGFDRRGAVPPGC
jgi:hypothetical protein